MIPDFITVTSSNVDAIAYDAASQTLFVRFKSRSRFDATPVIWAYTPVNQASYEALFQGNSVGRFISQLRKDPVVLSRRVPASEVAVA